MKTRIKRNQTRTFANLICPVLVLLITCCEMTTADKVWKSLFDGKSLQGWEQKGGKASYKVEDGQIVGTTVMNTHNSFLCTKEMYSDFIL